MMVFMDLFFFLLTGFHGFHVIIGTIFIIVCYFRHCLGHFSSTRHLGFEMSIWYWHFVDVVWIFLFLTLYWWGNSLAYVYTVVPFENFVYK
jgi:cytochrome c oxidase subunit 3